MGDTGNPISDAVDHTMRFLRMMNDGRSLGWTSVTDVLGATYEDTEKKFKKEIVPIQSGLTMVDVNVGGFFGGEFVLIGARPGGGKSAMAMAIAQQAARNMFHAGVVSLEMSDVQYGQRLYSNMGQINGMKFRKGEIDADDFQTMVRVGSEMSSAPIHFLFKARTVEEICAMATKKREAGELDILLVDYIQLCRTTAKIDANNERLIVSTVSRELKYLSTDLKIPVVGLAQLKRPANGSNRMPDMDSLKESGALEQDADQIILLHTPDNKDDPTVKPEDRDHFDGWADLGMKYTLFNICKQRQGRTCVVPGLFIPAYMRFTGIERGRP
jgi:replicative DNA helicase